MATVGQKTPLSIVVLDQNGKAIANPTFDSSPAWSNTNTAVETLTANGDTAELEAISVGDDTVDLSVVIAGQTFSASLAVVVEAQVPTKVEIVAGTPS